MARLNWQLIIEEVTNFDLQDQIRFRARLKQVHGLTPFADRKRYARLENTPRAAPFKRLVTSYHQEYRHENNLYYRSILKGTDDLMFCENT